MWKGGIAEYPNHYEMKKNRLIKLQKTKSRCEICNDKANTLHHKDGSKDNHTIKNLIILCHRCHSIIHTKIKNRYKSRYSEDTKYGRLYGMTLPQMMNTFGRSITFFTLLHKRNKLAYYLRTKKVMAKDVFKK